MEARAARLEWRALHGLHELEPRLSNRALQVLLIRERTLGELHCVLHLQLHAPLVAKCVGQPISGPFQLLDNDSYVELVFRAQQQQPTSTTTLMAPFLRSAATLPRQAGICG